MLPHPSRRQFVAGTLAALGDLAFVNHLPPVSADEARLPSGKVRLHADIEPLVRLIEETPRDRLLEAAAEKVRRGTSYQDLLAATFLAGVRGIRARPVGFEFHCVLVINSAHLASLASPDSDRWLPLFWAMDNFKESQAVKRKKGEGDWTLPAADEAKLPSVAQAKQRFIEAMDAWDEEGADRAITALVRSAGAAEIAELFWRYGARDFRDIGHKAIYAANSWRTLQAIGWRHAEPVLRSLTFACLEHEGNNPAKRDADADRPWRDNLPRAGKIRPHWQQGKVRPEAAVELLQTLRGATPGEASDAVVKLLNAETDPASAWDGIFLYAGELLMQHGDIVALHAVTSVNALHHAFQTSANDETRRMVLLQAPAYLTLFRSRYKDAGSVTARVDTLEKADVKSGGPEAVEEIFVAVGRDTLGAAKKTLALLESGKVEATALLTAARRLIFSKGTNAHDYKFCSAALEDYYHATPRWRNHYLATSLFKLRGASEPDNGLIRRARAALASA